MKTTRTERATALFLLLLALLLAAAPLAAEPVEGRSQARAHFDRGVALGKERAYGEALAEFQLAYSAFPSYTVLYNIAQALILLGRPSEAIVTLERYLVDGGASIEPKRRSEVEATLLRERQKTGQIVCSVTPSGAELTLDDKPVGRAPLTAPLRVDPGTHRIRATLDSGVSREASYDVSAQQVIQAELELSPPPATASPPPAPSPLPIPPAAPVVSPARAPAPPPPIRAAGHSRTWGYALGAAGIVLSGVAVGHYLWNRGRYADWQQRRDDYDRDPSDEARESANALGRSIPAASVVTVVLAVGAGVALGSGTLLVITASPASDPIGMKASGAKVQLRGEF